MNQLTSRRFKGEREVASELSLFWKKECFCLLFLYSFAFFFSPMLLVVVQMKLFTLFLTYNITEDRLGGQKGLFIFFHFLNFFCLHYDFCLYVCFHVNCSFQFFLCMKQKQVPECSPRVLRNSLPVL